MFVRNINLLEHVFINFNKTCVRNVDVPEFPARSCTGASAVVVFKYHKTSVAQNYAYIMCS